MRLSGIEVHGRPGRSTPFENRLACERIEVDMDSVLPHAVSGTVD
jgi:hypothetical protein